MQYVEIKITDKRFMLMGNGDPIKQMEERSAALREIGEKARQKEISGAYVYGEVNNPFPEWLRSCIKEAVVLTNPNLDPESKIQFLDENGFYRVEIEGDRSAFDRFYQRFGDLLKACTSIEALEWSEKNHVHVTSTPDDEDEAMRDLESYQRGAGPSSEDRPDKKKGT